MARQVNRLTDRKIASLSKPGWHPDGGNLYLQVSKSGSKSWIFRFTINGKTRPMGLGSTHTVKLADARKAAERYRNLVRDGIDPIEHRKEQLALRSLSAAKSITFRECAERYITTHREGWKNRKHIQQWENTLSTYVYPHFGDLPVATIDTGLVMNALEPIWTEKTETASRVRGRIEHILDWAKTREYRSGENPARWRGHLDNQLPARTKVKKVQHHPALSYEELGDFIEDLSGHQTIAAAGLEFLILTAARTGEVIGAKWDEINFSQQVWTVPAERMKADTDEDHRVPLSVRALEVLQRMQAVRQSEYIFPGGNKNCPLSNMAFLQLLKRMARTDITVHGFRSTFRDWVAEQTAYPNHVAEQALAHSIPSQVEAAYRRGDLFEKRRRMMDEWARYLSRSAGSGIVPIGRLGGVA